MQNAAHDTEHHEMPLTSLVETEECEAPRRKMMAWHPFFSEDIENTIVAEKNLAELQDHVESSRYHESCKASSATF